jgi:geranylgeranyl pyrophosphate synthase
MTQPAALTAISNDLERVERALLAATPPDYPELGSMMADLLHAGGKRVRPALVLLAARFNRYDLDALVDGAVAAELLHTATLVHDDTIDRADVRRGHRTINSFLPGSTTILIGDYIFAQSAIHAARPGNPAVVSVFARTLSEIVDGELRQLLSDGSAALDRGAYYRRIHAKTAALFACSAEIGALLSDAPTEHQAALRRYGQKVGQAYQVVDDILDFSATADQAGKPVGSDLCQGIPTLPAIIYLERTDVSHPHAQVVLRALSGGDRREAERAVQLVRDSDALRLAHAEAEKLADEAGAALLEMPSGEARSALYDLAAYVVERDH